MNRNEKKRIKPNEEALLAGIEIVKNSPLFSRLYGGCYERGKDQMGKTPAIADRDGRIYLNRDVPFSPEEWAYMIAHCKLHYAFGHFDEDKLPAFDKLMPDGSVKRQVSFDPFLWNAACDIYIARFLSDVKFGRPVCSDIAGMEAAGDNELKIYWHLKECGIPEGVHFGTALPGQSDMQGLDKPVVYKDWQKNGTPSAMFARALVHSVSQTVRDAGGHSYRDPKTETASVRAANWFISHYPLLGGLAAGFKVIEDSRYCVRNEISVAAVDVTAREIYVNPAAGLKEEELKFVLAHEYLHAGLDYAGRCQGRDGYLWNVACDYVINGWLHEMRIGSMPGDTLLYDPELKGMSAEEIYDRIVKEIRKYRKLSTFCGYGKGDFFSEDTGKRKNGAAGIKLDDFCRNALQQGLEYHLGMGRGLIPAGLIEEIRALAMPPIPWDVELGKWFDVYFKPLEARHTYARPSRRQGASPDIPRPRYVPADIPEYSRTYGVVVDTSGSMSAKTIGYALGAIASYSEAKEVPYARVVFCDAEAYDAGYISPGDIAGRVEVKGRGGTVLQPAVDLLQRAEDFPKDAPILLITDGMIEDSLNVKREHAYLLPRGNRLPFRAKGQVFYFEQK